MTPVRFGISVVPSTETLAGFVADGFDTLVFWPVEDWVDQVALLAAEVVPHVASRGQA